MNTHAPLLIAADIGNVNTKFRRQGGAWEIEPSLVRMLSGRAGYSFTNDAPVRPLVYLSSPAGIEPHAPYLVGRDAQRAGVTDVAVITLRVGAERQRQRRAARPLARLPAAAPLRDRRQPAGRHHQRSGRLRRRAASRGRHQPAGSRDAAPAADGQGREE